MSKPRVLMVLAHPDDEVIVGWPVLQSPEFHKEILICSSDKYNPKRKWCAHRKETLVRLCAQLSIPVRCLDYDSEFYRTPHRVKRRKRRFPLNLLPKPAPPLLLGELCRSIVAEVKARDYDYLFTHNFWGEYGHMDHILLNSIIFNNCPGRVLVSDLRLPLDWLALSEDPAVYNRLLEGKLHSRHQLNLDFYAECERIYRADRVWTWSEPPLAAASLYEFG